MMLLLLRASLGQEGLFDNHTSSAISALFQPSKMDEKSAPALASQREAPVGVRGTSPRPMPGGGIGQWYAGNERGRCPRSRMSASLPPRLSARPPAPKPLAPPAERVANRYVVKEELASGGMGVVYRVLDRSTGEERALKRLNKNATNELFLIEAFEREY